MFKRAEPHEYVAAFGARFAVALFGALPLDLASALGGWIGRTIGPWLPVHRTAVQNLARAMPELDEAQRHRILMGMWDNLGRVLAEYPHLGDFVISGALRPGRIDIVGGEHIDAIRDSGKPGIFFSAHYGNWELMSLAATQYGAPLVHVYRAANNPLTEEILQNLRKPVGGRHVPKGMQAARELLKALKQNELLGMLVDQKLATGIPVPFFGRDAMTAPAIAELALKAGCPVIPAYVQRLEGARFRIIVEAPIHLEDTGDRERDVLAAMTMINAKIEGWIRERPDHWFWVHKRWPKD
ncbi:MAG TPA: lauroyl acyltransferase [Ferrovibrio sp.]|uniref:lysophospholipid acyltransferase family protein n=1 Tax=Ferrovibrio sp. TaxID=1917215 RepID=UPI002B4ABE5B|nr:lauroyl acyltransferase [Ferrovibrio sp.]HLT77850.1 lauroyl acyltransferase [Ferrovibrio sp.]